ncbi:MAG: lycopene cyclase [Lewinellaceae bacterium]|nr:lycopene cyclase [Lewinellaceae bacterium]
MTPSFAEATAGKNDDKDPMKNTILLAGSGLSGLTLALECAKRPFFKDKKIVLIDRDDKSRNDRTWCFWAKKGEPLPPVGHKIWEKCLFFEDHFEKVLDIAPYQYHMVRGLDFYSWAKTELTKYSNVQSITANILDIEPHNGIVKTDAGDFQGDWVFNSARYKIDGTQYTVDGSSSSFLAHRSSFLLQHFKGWIIETPTPAFDPAAVTFMDYRLEQHGETRFVYVLPFSETRALVEFTVFSPALCPAEEYDAELCRYITEVLKIKDYAVEEEEFGVIPMTDSPLSPKGEGRVINIGTAGGFVKASSGYAFLRTQRKIRAFVDAWEKTGSPDPMMLLSHWSFRALDSIMLRVLREGSVSGKDFFSQLFQKLPAPLVFRFLDEDASLMEVLRVLSAPPTWPFFKTALLQFPFLFRNLRSIK